MKRLLYVLFLLPLGLSAQNMYNVSSMLENDITAGTARYVGMGGSMSALGADLSTMGTNPAGMALFRRNDFSFTAGLNIKTNKAVYEGSEVESSNTNAFVGNTSFVLSLERNGDYLKYLNFGIGYRKKNNLTSDFEMNGYSDGFSQQYVMNQLYAQAYNKFDHNNLSSGLYTNLNINWLPLLGAEAGLSDGDDFLVYPDTTLIWNPERLDFYEEVRGGVHAVDFNMSANIKDRLYLGATLGITSVNYNRYSAYTERNSYGVIYTLENNLLMKGTGFDIKLGAILRPFKYAPFKIGVSVHTPTWYSLNEYTWATVSYDGFSFCTTDEGAYGSEFVASSKVASPWRFNAAMSYTFGKYVAVNAEYEYADYSTAKFSGRGWVPKAQNEEIEYNLTAQHIARIGAEVNIDGFAVRAGYNYMTAPFKRDAYKCFDNASVVETSTDYMNRFEKDIITLGMGFRGKMFYFDLAYMLECQKADFYPFYDAEVINPAAQVDIMNHSAVATLGLRF